ncbi:MULTISPECIES: hypothetical protein [unclassified Paenibacillus]|uniref:hypothetical protein n=1 Tax=unclassified Paenibacillus TaxID=185978 RepID=UPI00363EE117
MKSGDTTGLIKTICNGDLIDNMARKVITIEETVMSYFEYERSALYEGSSQSVSKPETTK